VSAEFRALMRYRAALESWYARMFAAARDGREFDERRPDPADFIGGTNAS